MKTILNSISILALAILLQACAGKKENNNTKHSFKGGLNITLAQDKFGEPKQVAVNQQDLLKHYQETDPNITELEAVMYDNFDNYAPVGFSYAYTKVNSNIFDDAAPFGFQDIVYDDIQDLTINGKKCRKSVFTDSDTDRRITILSCKDKGQSWDIFMQSFYASQPMPEDIDQTEKKNIDEALQLMNNNTQAIVDAALKSVEIL